MIKSQWRETDATAFEMRAEAIETWLEHTEDLIEMLGDDDVVTELRGLCGIARSRKDDLVAAAENLRKSSAAREDKEFARER
jgi:hypothetical protein